MSLAKTQNVLQMLRFRITDTSSTTGAGGRSVDYTYDAWARLKTAVTAGSTRFPQWGLKWAYDRYGNRTNQTVTHGSGPSSSLGISTSTNRITDSGYTYDSSGNLTNDGLNALVYDGENHVTSSTQSGATANYTYDGGGLRIKKVSASTTTIYIFSGTKVIAEYENGASVTSPTREYLYSGGQLLASIEGSTTRYHLKDHLSTRVIANTSGSILAEQGQHPFGESWYSTGTSGTPGKWKFTSYERDSESDNDYAMARFHVSRLGRFNSPDPIAGSVADPQSMNRYAYTRNDPINLADPSGLAWDDDPAWLVAFRNGWWDNTYSMIMALMGAMARESFGYDYYRLPGTWSIEQELARHESIITSGWDPQLGIYRGDLAEYQNAILEALKNPECAKLFGNAENAQRALNGINRVVNVEAPGWNPVNAQDLGAWGVIVLGGATAAVLPPPMSTAPVPWNGSSFPIYVGNGLNSYTFRQQLTIFIHELLHAALIPNDRDLDRNTLYWDFIISDSCDTDVPPEDP